MTIGLAAFGPNAGAAVIQTLATAEKICHGAIGGFVAAAAVFENHVTRAETQTGGVGQLGFSSSSTEFESAVVAGLISSGPNRPDPLSAFVAALPGVGLVTGHRMPNAIDSEGNPMNQNVLQLIADGIDPRSAVKQVIDVNPDADCGLIAVNSKGCGYAANTLAVNRHDAGFATGTRQNAAVWVLHNAVQPFESLGPLLVEVALNVMCPILKPTGHIVFNQGCPVETGLSPQIHINEQYTVEKIVTRFTNTGETAWSLDIGYQPPVLLHQLEVAKLLYEPLLMATANRLLSADGESIKEVTIGVKSNGENFS